MGGPGTGKGTQCEMIATKFGYSHLSSGDLLRNEIMANTERGMQLFGTMEKGNMVPNDEVITLLAEAMEKRTDAEGFTIDGFPANMEQAEMFESRLGSPNKIVVLDLHDEVMKIRLSTRGNFDDRKEAVEQRINNYNEKTKPILAKYKDSVKKVNADLDKETVFNEICKVLQSWTKL